MSSGLILLFLVGFAFLATHVVSDWVAKRLVVVSGAEYLVVGLLLGPSVLGVLSEDRLDQFAPVTLLTLGFLGLALGMRLHLPKLIKVSGVTWRLSFAQSFLTLATVAATLVVLLMMRDNLTLAAALPPAIALGAIATVSLPAAVEVGARALGREGPTVQLLRTSALVDGLVGVCAFGMLLALDHAPVEGFTRTPTPVEWAVIATGIGVASGALFHLFIGDESSGDRTVIALIGATLLATGTSAHLDLSPLYSTTVMGVILVNTSRQRQLLLDILKRAERPLTYVLLVLAGAAWRPGAEIAVLVPIVLFLLARWVGKVGGARLATRTTGALATHGPDWGRALLGQGSLGLALGYTWLRRDGAPLPDLVFSAAVAAMLLTDLSAARLVRSVLEPLLPPEGTATAAHAIEGPGELADGETSDEPVRGGAS